MSLALIKEPGGFSVGWSNALFISVIKSIIFYALLQHLLSTTFFGLWHVFFLSIRKRHVKKIINLEKEKDISGSLLSLFFRSSFIGDLPGRHL
jgi:hypothetical protein